MTDGAAQQLARDVLSLAVRAGMPQEYWHTDSRVARACEALGISTAEAVQMAGFTPAPAVETPTGRPEVWTDGACSGNPGPGGWGWITPEGEFGAGPDPATTNQRMEIMAVVDALTTLKMRPIEVVSDSQYVINGATKWHHGWAKKGWTNSKGQPVANRDLWEQLIPLLEGVTFRWVKGHAGHALNEAADQLAVGARDSQREHRNT